MAKRKLSAFERQFVANRRAGKKEFTFGGKSYSTKQKGEGGGGGVKTTKVAGFKRTPSKNAPTPTSRYPMGSRENPRVVTGTGGGLGKPSPSGGNTPGLDKRASPPGYKKGDETRAKVPTPTKKPEISKVTGRPIPIDKPRERKADPTSTAPNKPKVPTPTPKSSVISKVTGRPIPTGPREHKPAPTPARPNTPSHPVPAGQGTGDIYRIVEKNRTNPPPATADNAAAMAKFNAAAGRGQRVAAGTPFPAAPARKAAGTPLPPTPLRKAAGTPTPGPYAGARTPRGDAQRAEFLATEKRNIGDGMYRKTRSVATPNAVATKTTLKAPNPERFGGVQTTAKTKRVDRVPPHPDRFGGPLLKKKTVVARKD